MSALAAYALIGSAWLGICVVAVLIIRGARD